MTAQEDLDLRLKALDHAMDLAKTIMATKSSIGKPVTEQTIIQAAAVLYNFLKGTVL